MASRHALSSHAEGRENETGGTQKKRRRTEKGEAERGGMPRVSHHSTLFHQPRCGAGGRGHCRCGRGDRGWSGGLPAAHC